MIKARNVAAVFLFTGIAVVSADTSKTVLQSLYFDFTPSILEQTKKTVVAARTFTVKRCAKPPVIDGFLNDETWKTVSDLTRLRKGKPLTDVKICFDDKAIYYSVRCLGKPGTKPKGEKRTRDDRTWRDDCIEIWMNPWPRKAMTHQFIINCLGSTLDQRNGVKGYNPKWSSAVTQKGDDWFLEAAIPFQALGLSSPVDRIAFNIGRNGPNMTARSWGKEYGNCASSFLIFEGVVNKAVEEEAKAFKDSPFLAIQGTSLRCAFDRSFARRGERWIEINLSLKPSVSLEKTKLMATIYRIGESKPLDSAIVVPKRDSCTLFIDPRAKQLSKARLEIKFIENEIQTGSAEILLRAESASRITAGTKIPIIIDFPDDDAKTANQPVTFGVPFKRGELWNVKRLVLTDANNNFVPCQTEITGLWDMDGAIQWVRFDALVAPGKKYFVSVGDPVISVAPHKRVRAEKNGDAMILDTGVAKYTIGKGASPIREIWRGDKLIATSKGTKGLYVIDQKGRVATADSAEMTIKVESAGPVAASIRCEGFYKTSDGVPLARHITRIECFAGKPFAKITHTLILTSDTNKVWFKDIGWEFDVAAGADPKALFNIDYKNSGKIESVPMEKSSSSAWMIQNSHYLLAHGENHFSVDAILADGKEKRIFEGGECGDWAALTGANGGLMMNCRNAARMHPKEFEIKGGKITLRLFSDRAGDELDFRSATLLKKWDFDNWYKNSTCRSSFKDPKKFKQVLLNYESNAQGWARTHLLTISPLPKQSPQTAAAEISKSQRQPVYAMAAPEWIYRSNAMGPNYPRDTERFPATERLVDAALNFWIDRDAKWGDYGFVDYGSGPHIYYHSGNNYVDMYRYVFNTYTLRANLWLQYARSGNRRLREFTFNSTRTLIDAAHANWDTKTNIKGIHRGQAFACGLLPFYWGKNNRLDSSSSTNLNTYIWCYQLTGYRRAKECVEEWSQGIKRYWSPAKARRTSRIIMLTRMLSQAYTVTWDPALKELAFATTDLFEDENGELGLDYSRTHYGASYKTQVDLRALIEAYHIFGTDNYLNTALKTSHFWWKKNLGTDGFGYNSPMAITGNFLYNQTGDPVYAQGLAVAVRHNASAYNPDGPLPSGVTGAFSTAFTFDIGYALDVLVRSGADKKQQASWLGYMDIREPASIIIRKPENIGLAFQFKTPASSLTTGGSVTLKAVNPPYSARCLDLNRMTEAGLGGASFGTIHIDKGAPLCDYRISFAEKGNHQFYANSNVPMVLHAPDYWYPTPSQNPGIRYYFKVPAKGVGMRIFFEGTTKLFTPNGKMYPNDKPSKGWINLPEGTPGLWSFETKENKLVNCRNIPPFFAFQNPKNYFTPSISWKKDEPTQEKATAVSTDTEYAEGAIATPENKALNLSGKRAFTIPPGVVKKDDGSAFLPQHKGTIEFWIRPQWDSFTMPEGRRRFILGVIDKPRCYMSMAFQKNKQKKELFGAMTTSGPKGRSNYRQYRKQTLFERDKWTHVAFVWGQRDGVIEYPSSKLANNMFRIEIFINGKLGKQKKDSYLRNQTIGGYIKRVIIGNGRKNENIDAFIDELRISDIQRYRANFTPPSRSKEFKLDKHTRALFHFNGNLDGESSSKLKLKGEIAK